MILTVKVAQAKMHDEMFFTTGVEFEEFEEALIFYMNKDQEIQKAMQQHMVKMSDEMRKAGMVPGMWEAKKSKADNVTKTIEKGESIDSSWVS